MKIKTHILLSAWFFITLTLASTFAAEPVRDNGNHWVGTWSASAQEVEPALLPPDANLEGSTIRQIVRTSIGGKQLRVRISNAFPAAHDVPLLIYEAGIALSTGAAAIKPGTSKPLTFGGQSSVRIAPGAVMLSDPVDFGLPPNADLAVTMSIWVPFKDNGITGHRSARSDSYLVNGFIIDPDATTPTATSDLPSPTPTKIWYYLSGVDVLAPADTAAIVFLGDSLTDGKGSTEGANRRWPDILSNRLRANPATGGVGVLNQGIGGNTLLNGGIGQPALARFDRDVLAQSGARWLIVFEGINDLGDKRAHASELIAAYKQIIARAHARGLRVYGATLTPCGDSFYDKPGVETERQKVNDWIRTSRAFDAVLDFDAVVRDPAIPTCLLPAADSGDHLHLNDKGYRMLAESVNLDLFQTQ